MVESLKDCVVLITGAASGIGRATAIAAHGKGAKVVAADVDESGLQSLSRDVELAPGSLLVRVTDVTQPSECAALMDAVSATHGGLDVLANVAGVQAVADRVESLPESEWDRVFAVNVKAAFLLSRLAIPLIRKRGGGTILNVSSVHAFATMPDSAAYAASKGALVALTRQMAIDLAPDLIRVVGVAPGSVDTPMTRRAVERSGKSLDELGFSTQPTRLGRVGTPEEVAEVILWLASSEAKFINGSTVVADGGLLAQL